MSDDLRSVNGLSPQVGRHQGVRQAGKTDMDPDEGQSGPGYQPQDWNDSGEPATKRHRPRKRGPEHDSSELPSPLQEQLDRMRTIDPDSMVDTKSLRGKQAYLNETTVRQKRRAAI